MRASSFNADLSKWDVSHVASTGRMFARARVIHADMSTWDVSSVTDMYEMFNGAISFN